MADPHPLLRELAATIERTGEYGGKKLKGITPLTGEADFMVAKDELLEKGAQEVIPLTNVVSEPPANRLYKEYVQRRGGKVDPASLPFPPDIDGVAPNRNGNVFGDLSPEERLVEVGHASRHPDVSPEDYARLVESEHLAQRIETRAAGANPLRLPQPSQDGGASDWTAVDWAQRHGLNWRDVMGVVPPLALGATALTAGRGEAASLPEMSPEQRYADYQSTPRQSVDPNIGAVVAQKEADKQAELERGTKLLLEQRDPLYEAAATGMRAVGSALRTGVKGVLNSTPSAALDLAGSSGLVSPETEFDIRTDFSPLAGSVEEQLNGAPRLGGVTSLGAEEARKRVLGEGRTASRNSTVGTVGALTGGFSTTFMDREKVADFGEAAQKEVVPLAVYALPMGSGIGGALASGAVAESVLGGDPVEGALTFGALHGATQAAVGAVKLGAKAVKGVAETVTGIRAEQAAWRRAGKAPALNFGKVVGATPPEEVATLTRQLADAPAWVETAPLPVEAPRLGSPTTPPVAEPPPGRATKAARPQASAHVLDREGDTLVLKTVGITPDGDHHLLSTKPVLVPEDIASREAKDVAILVTPEAKEAAAYEEVTRLAHTPETPGFKKVKLDEPFEHFNPDIMEGGKVVVSYGDGAVGIHHINGQKAQRESLKVRGLVEWKENGEMKRAFFSNQHAGVPGATKLPGTDDMWSETGPLLIAPDPAEKIPGAILKDQIAPKSFRAVENDRALDDILFEAQRARSRARIDAELAADPAAKVTKNADGTPLEMPPFPTPDDEVNGGIPQLPDYFKASQKQKAEVMDAWLKVVQNMVPSHSRGKNEMMQWAQTQYSLANGSFAKVGDTVYQQIWDRYGLSKMDLATRRAFEEDFQRVLSDNMTPQMMREKWPAYAAAEQTFYEDVKAGLHAREREIEELGGKVEGDPVGALQRLLDPESSDAERRTAENALRTYSTLLYNRFSLKKGQWYRQQSKDAAWMAEKKQWILDNIVMKNSTWANSSNPESLAQWMLEDMMGKNDGLRGKGSGVPSWLQSQIGRKDIDPVIAEILGEVRNGPQRLAASIETQTARIANLKMCAEVARSPYFVPKDQWAEGMLASGEWVKVDDDPARFGRLAGGLLTAEAAEALLDAPKVATGAGKWLTRFGMELNRQAKAGQTMLRGPMAYAAQVKGNLKGIFFSGAPLNPFDMVPNMVGMFSDLRAYRTGLATIGAPSKFIGPLTRQQGADKVAVERMQRAVELFGTFGAFGRSELTQIETAIERHVIDGEAKTVLDLPAQLWGGWKSVQSKLGGAFSIPDEVSKYSCWRSLMEKGGIDLETGEVVSLVKAKRFLGPQYGLSMGLTSELKSLVEREAARRVSASFPMLDRTGNVVRHLQATAGLIGNSYFGIRSELLRNDLMFLKRLWEGEPGLRFHVFKVAAFGGALLGANQMLKLRNGITPEMEAEAWGKQPDATHQWNPQVKLLGDPAKEDSPTMRNLKWAMRPGPMALPVRDSKGDIQFINTQQFEDMFSLLQGAPNSNPLARVAGNLLMLPIAGSPVGNVAADWLVDVGVPIARPQSGSQLGYADKSAMAADALLNWGPVPGGTFLENVAKLHDRSQFSRQGPTLMDSSPVLTKGQAVGNFLGVGFIPTDGAGVSRAIQQKQSLDRDVADVGKAAKGIGARPTGLVNRPTVGENVQRAVKKLEKKAGSKK